MMDREHNDRPLLRSVVGTIYAFTTVYSGPVGIETPYQLGWVDTDGERVFARVVGTPMLESAGILTWIDHEGWWFECAP
jgi:uncharacterized OB-fold protein